MVSLLYILTVGSSLLATSSARPSSSSHGSTPLPPSQDPWYTAPPDFESAAPGAILRLRPAPGNLTTVVGNCSAAYNILFRSTDAHYRPSWAVTTLLVPKETTGDSLLSYQIPYNTPDVDFSPSYILYSQASLAPDIANALGQGWYVNVPDHEGPKAVFGAAVVDGHATLDSVRAVLAKGFGLGKDAKYAMWGYSGGSLASGMAAELQVQYAPELKFSGAAVGGLVSNATGVLDSVDQSYYSGLIPLVLFASTQEYPAAHQYLLSQLKTEGKYNRTGFIAVGHMDPTTAFAYYQDQPMWEYFKHGKAIIDAPIIRRVFNDNGYLGFHGTPQMPLFVYKAIHDEVTPIDSTDALVDRFCSVDVNIHYERNELGNHIEEMTNGDARAFKWLKSVFDGTRAEKYGARGCTIKNVAVNVTAPAS